MDDCLVLVHALDILGDDVILAQHRLLVRVRCALLAAQRATLAPEAVILLSALRMVLFDVSIEGVLMSGQAHHVVLRLRPCAHLGDGVLVKALLRLVDHALVVAARHHFLLADLGLLAAEVVLDALRHVVDENGVGLLDVALLLWTLARQVV